jgi:hypothetical protein
LLNLIPVAVTYSTDETDAATGQGEQRFDVMRARFPKIISTELARIVVVQGAVSR